MRPIELTLDGFRSFHGAQTLRWEGRRLVGIVGPIGSGKSSILDGISFALYGKTPRIARDVLGLINQRRDQGSVALLFEVDGIAWRVVRSLRRTGQPAHALYRVEGDEEVRVADRKADVTERVAELLGLDFEGFRRSILLAQGEFDRFLRGSAAERDDVLKGVFGLDRIDHMRERAKAHRDAASGELQTLDALRLSSAADEALLGETREALEPARNRARQLRELETELAGLGERRRSTAADQASAATRLSDLAALGERFPDKRAADDLLQSLRTNARDLDEAKAALAASLERCGGKQALERAGELVAAFEARAAIVADGEQLVARAKRAHAEAAESLERIRRDAGAAADAAAAADSELAQAQEGRRAAEALLHDATHGAMAATLRADLVPGGPCPVCLQPVATLPPEAKAPEVERAEAGLSSATALLGKAESGARDAAAAAVQASAAVEAGAERVAERAQAEVEAVASLAAAGEALDATTEAARALLGDGEPRLNLESRRAELTAAEQRVELLQQRTGAGDRSLDELATALAALAGALGIEAPPDRDPGALEAAMRGLREEWLAQRQAAERQRADAEEALRGIDGEIAALLEGAALAADADPSAAALEAAAVVAALEGRAEDLQARLGRVEELEKQQSSIVARRDRFERLAADLARPRFPAYVLTERRRSLSDLGGALFDALSGSRYRFSDDGEFDVLDLAAAERRRSADSLSGGETFLASLALALALAETVAREGGRLDAFFLDEGFGSLDSEHLDLAMEGIERLSSMAERLVVVVSHVSEMRERIEDLITLAKDPLTGDTIVVAGAAGG